MVLVSSKSGRATQANNVQWFGNPSNQQHLEKGISVGDHGCTCMFKGNDRARAHLRMLWPLSAMLCRHESKVMSGAVRRNDAVVDGR